MTILWMTGRLNIPDSVDALISGIKVNHIPGSKRMVFQNYALYRYMTVFDNSVFGLKVQRKSKAEIKSQIEELMELISTQALGKVICISYLTFRALAERDV